MNWNELTGYMAAFLTTAAYVPQAWKTIKTRSTQDLSLGTFLMIFVGTLLWFTYGLTIQNMPMILANGITSALAGIILYLKLSTK